MEGQTVTQRERDREMEREREKGRKRDKRTDRETEPLSYESSDLTTTRLLSFDLLIAIDHSVNVISFFHSQSD